MASHMVAIAIAIATVHVDDGRWNEIRCMRKVIALYLLTCIVNINDYRKRQTPDVSNSQVINKLYLLFSHLEVQAS